MKIRALSTLIGVLVFGIGLLVAVSTGFGQTPDAKTPIPNDPAFKSFIDLDQVGDALAGLDAARITDCALLLAQGEKVLLREHRGVSSAKLFTVALKVAADNRDEVTLKRLDKALRGSDNAELTALLSVSLLQAKTRKVDPFTNEKVSPESRALHASLSNEISLAKNLNDRPHLEHLQQTVSSMPELTTNHREHLHRQIKDALDSMAPNADPQEVALSQLASTSMARKTKAEEKK